MAGEMPEDMSHYGTVTFALTLVISWGILRMDLLFLK
ncbi:hypothetical protein N040_13965 [Serratia marcescens EGD-HP20]|nr:hypothetical protein N040_13965 [Serratia marcescens EGD-HP20]